MFFPFRLLAVVVLPVVFSVHRLLAVVVLPVVFVVPEIPCLWEDQWVAVRMPFDYWQQF